MAVVHPTIAAANDSASCISEHNCVCHEAQGAKSRSWRIRIGRAIIAAHVVAVISNVPAWMRCYGDRTRHTEL